MKIIELTQGSPAWHAHRANHFNASDAPAMLGVSPYKTRAQLLKEMATGLSEEIDADLQRRFDEGHRAEALARPLAEQIIGDDLFPVVGTDGQYSASFDGLTLTEDTAFEHKSLNDELRAVMVPGCTGADLPKAYRVQMEGQCLVSAATKRVLFMASKWAGEVLIEERHCWYEPDPVLRAEIKAGWAQFDADLAAYVPEPAAAVVVGRAPDQLPALFVQIAGGVQATNLPEFKAAAIEVFRGIRTDLATDQDFADAEKAVKFCDDVESKLKAAKEQALGQTATIDELFRTIDAISAEARAKRLELEKLVKRRKDEIRAEIVAKAAREVDAFRGSLNVNLQVPLQPVDVRPQLADAIKGKRTITSLQDAAAQVVADAKLAATTDAERYRSNLAVLADFGRPELFGDRDALVRSKQPEDLRNLARGRIAEANLREQRRLEEERARIRQEEEARAQREAEQKAEQDRQRIREEEAAKLRAEQSTNPPAVTASAPAAATIASGTAHQTEAGGAPMPAGARIKLGDINARIAPLSITAEGLAQLGFQSVGTDRAAKLYPAAVFPDICKALIARLQGASIPMQEAA